MGFRNDALGYATSLDEEADLNSYPRTLAPLADTWCNRALMRSSLCVLAAASIRWANQNVLDFHGVQPQATGTVTKRGEVLFRDQIALMKLLSERHGFKLLWVDQPINRSALEHGWAHILDDTRAIMHDELRRQNTPLLSAHDRYDHDAFPMVNDVHCTDAGYEHLAKILAPQVLRALTAGAQ
jgi:hypothetical protein